ncbi:hypothetical protein GGS20DRAFT_389503 [Poronia punctata]|nr:hypothetical protein GGS20DRAFT_389503 [Poronia punctata]
MLAAIGLLLAASLGSLVSGDEVQCWAPDGITLADNETVVPCNKLGIQQNGVHSSCCRLDGDARQRDFCTTAGLCLNTHDSALRREYCTDKTWKSPACVNICTDPEDGGSRNSSVKMTACSDGSGKYCCGENNLECCGTDRAIEIPTQMSVISDDDQDSSDSFKNATIGLAVVLGALFLAAAGVMTWLLRQNKAIKRELSEKINQEQSQPLPPTIVTPYQDTFPTSPQPQYKPPGSPGIPTYEMNSSQTQRYSELDASTMAPRSEMSSPGPHLYDNGMGSPRSHTSFHN